MKSNSNFVYIDNQKIAHIIYNYIQVQIDQQLALYSTLDLIHNEQANLAHISNIIENDLYEYISTLINKHIPSSVINNIGELPVFIEFLISKWNPIIRTELEYRIELLNPNSSNKQQVS